MLRVLTTGPGTPALTGETDRDQLLLVIGNSKKIHTIMFHVSCYQLFLSCEHSHLAGVPQYMKNHFSGPSIGKTFRNICLEHEATKFCLMQKSIMTGTLVPHSFTAWWLRHREPYLLCVESVKKP